jgi:hypothetical protein
MYCDAQHDLQAFAARQHSASMHAATTAELRQADMTCVYTLVKHMVKQYVNLRG